MLSPHPYDHPSSERRNGPTWFQRNNSLPGPPLQGPHPGPAPHHDPRPGLPALPGWGSPAAEASVPALSGRAACPLVCCLLVISPLLLACSTAKPCPTLCDPVDCSPPGSSVHGMFPATITGVGYHFLTPDDLPNGGIESKPSALHAEC